MRWNQQEVWYNHQESMREQDREIKDCNTNTKSDQHFRCATIRATRTLSTCTMIWLRLSNLAAKGLECKCRLLACSLQYIK